jgi:hypothetical protein
MAFSLLVLAAATSAAVPPSPQEEAVSAIQEFAAYCDGGTAVWGTSLCGPLIFVEPDSRRAIASVEPDVPGFVREGTVWVGPLPPGVPMANTAVELGGRRFAEIVLPLPPDRPNRRVLLAHESFHRIQPELGFTGRNSDNSQLDTKDGRIWARLEMAALDRALAGSHWRPAVRDALAFRAKRLALFPDAEASEAVLLANEGLAEYTGVKVGAGADAIAFASKRLETGADRQSLIRSFGYVVGPAYGLLLDRTGVEWRKAALEGTPIPELLAKVISPSRRVSGAQYGKAAIVAEETARSERIEQRRRALTAELIVGPTVTFPGSHLQLEFDSNTLFSLGDAGTVYSRDTSVHGSWGVLRVSGDVLLAPDWSFARVAGPGEMNGQSLTGPGWSIELSPGYELVPGDRPGNFVVTKVQGAARARGRTD